MDTYWIYDGTDENGIVGTVAAGLRPLPGETERMAEIAQLNLFASHQR
jgi:hypothetical protein